jgi:hypothetical protein
MNVIQNTNTQNILKKQKVTFTKLSNNMFKLESFVENKNIFLEKLLNFDLIHLFYQVNIQYFQAVDFKLINENEAILFILMKPLFQQLGYNPRYVNLKIIKNIKDNGSVCFNASICNELSEKIREYPSALQSPLLNVSITCDTINNHLLYISEILTFDENYFNYSIVEKLISPILKIIFKQTIQAVEKINITKS